MPWLPFRLRRRVTADDRARDLAREIRSHLELEAEEQRLDGASPDEARWAARRAFGNPLLIAEDGRAVWGRPALEACVQDLRYGVRLMRRSPVFSIVAAASSALGIGACAVIAALLNTVLLKPLPVEAPDRLMHVSELDRRSGEAGNELSYLDFRDLQQRTRIFDGVAAANYMLPLAIGAEDDPQRQWGALVTANYFDVVRPLFLLGRGFDRGRDDVRGAPPVIVLSHDLWRGRFNGDRGIVGRDVSVNGKVATVIGVTADGFAGTQLGFASAFWIPFSMLDEVEGRSGPVTQNRRRFWLDVVARLPDGATLASAQSELEDLGRVIDKEFPRPTERVFQAERAGQIDARLRGLSGTMIAIGFGLTGLVLAAACANVANLLLGRASARRREIAARMALGASRARLVRQLVTESVLLAGIGGLGGVLIAAYVTSLFSRLRAPLGWPIDLSVALDLPVVLFCAALSIVTGLTFGLVPALRATRADLVADLKGDAAGRAQRGRLALRHALVVTQVAMCTVLLLCSGLFLRSLQAARGLDPGLAHRNLLLLGLDPGLGHRPDEESRRLLADILARAEAVPGIESATLTTAVPLTVIISNSNFVAEPHAPDTPRTRADIYGVGPRFFSTLGIPLLAGRDFGTEPPQRHAIVNDAFARAVFPGQSPIGKTFIGDGKKLEIVGVAGTVKSRTLAEAPRPSIFLPVLSDYRSAEAPLGITLVVKARDRATAAVAPVRDAIRQADRSLAVFDVRTMDSHISDALLLPRLTWLLSSAAGCVGLVLAIIGVYGVISFAIAQRRRELGIRLAIGARPREIVMMLLQQGALLSAAGIAIGLAAGFGLARFTASLLYGITPSDPVTFVVAPACVALVSVLACLLPARAAARLDPVEVLRRD